MSESLYLSIARGEIAGVKHINKFGRNPDVDGAEMIWDRGGKWSPPTAARIHDLASTSTSDAGTLVSTGVATYGSRTRLVDSGADFVSDGVSTGDAVIAVPHFEHSVVESYTATALTCHATRHGHDFHIGEEYIVVSPDSIGTSLVHVFGLNAEMEEQEEFIIMNGTTDVPTVNEYWRIWRMHADGASNRDNTNVGNITAMAQVDSTVNAQINAGNGQTLMAIYTVPTGKTAYMTQLYASLNRSSKSAGAMADLSLVQVPFACCDGSGHRVDHVFGLAVDGNSTYRHSFEPFKPILENTDIYIECTEITDADTDITAGFDLIIVDN